MSSRLLLGIFAFSQRSLPHRPSRHICPRVVENAGGIHNRNMLSKGRDGTGRDSGSYNRQVVQRSHVPAHQLITHSVLAASPSDIGVMGLAELVGDPLRTWPSAADQRPVRLGAAAQDVRTETRGKGRWREALPYGPQHAYCPHTTVPCSTTGFRNGGSPAINSGRGY